MKLNRAARDWSRRLYGITIMHSGDSGVQHGTAARRRHRKLTLRSDIERRPVWRHARAQTNFGPESTTGKESTARWRPDGECRRNTYVQFSEVQWWYCGGVRDAFYDSYTTTTFQTLWKTDGTILTERTERLS